MINTDVSSLQSQNLVQLSNNLSEHLEYGNKCGLFFKSYKKLKLEDGHLSTSDSCINSNSFSKMYLQISDCCIEKWEAEYNQLSNEIFAIEKTDENTPSNQSKNEECKFKLKEIEEKISLCRKIDDLFCKKIIKLFRKAPQVLQHNDSLFFLPTSGGYSGTIGECHCSTSVDRSNRRSFSESLCEKISEVFPKTKPLTIASIGAGLCFNEIEIHALAKHKGHTIDHWVIVDPTIIPKTITNFKNILRWENQSVTVLTEEKKCYEYFDQIEKGLCTNVPDIFLFIDVDVYISSNMVLQMSSKIQHHSLFAEFVSRGPLDVWERTKFICINKK